MCFLFSRPVPTQILSVHLNGPTLLPIWAGSRMGPCKPSPNDTGGAETDSAAEAQSPSRHFIFFLSLKPSTKNQNLNPTPAISFDLFFFIFSRLLPPFLLSQAAAMAAVTRAARSRALLLLPRASAAAPHFSTTASSGAAAAAAPPVEAAAAGASDASAAAAAGAGEQPAPPPKRWGLLKFGAFAAVCGALGAAGYSSYGMIPRYPVAISREEGGCSVLGVFWFELVARLTCSAVCVSVSFACSLYA